MNFFICTSFVLIYWATCLLVWTADPFLLALSLWPSSYQSVGHDNHLWCRLFQGFQLESSKGKEALACISSFQRRLPICRTKTSQVHNGQYYGQAGSDHLHHLSLRQPKGSAQSFMPWSEAIASTVDIFIVSSLSSQISRTSTLTCRW